MIPRIAAALTSLLLASGFLLSPQTPSNAANSVEAARLNNLGVAYMNQQLFEKGLKNFQQAGEADPKLAIARLNQGVAYLNLQKIDEAKTALQDALKQDAKNPNAWYNLGLLAKNTGDAPAAIDAFKRVTEIDASDPDTWYFLGTAYVQAKQFPQAIEAFQNALKLNPLHASAEFGLSRAYQQSGDVEHAREHLKKFQYITQNKIGSPMSLAYGEQGQYSRAVESPSAVLKAPAPIKVRFVDVTKEAGITGVSDSKEQNSAESFSGTGACFLDFDGDGKIDLFLSSGGPEGGVGLYHNLGGGKFEDVTRKAGLDPSTHAVGCTTGDYANDGATDLAFTSQGHVVLLHNEKNGKFKDVTDASGIKNDGVAIGLTFIDHDHDGDLDLYVTRSSNGFPQSKGDGSSLANSSGPGNLMWRNNGDGTFTNVTDDTGLSGQSGGFAAIGTDYNNDRAVDLVVTQPGGASIFENPREGKFHKRQGGFDYKPEYALGVVGLDFNHDGWMDLAFTQGASPGLTLWANPHGNGLISVTFPENNLVRAYGVAAFDYDNDGWVDLVAVGETKEGKGEVRLFRNLGPDGFKDVTTDVGLDKLQLKDPRAIITGDYDNDGTTDLLITQNHGPAVLLKNEGANQNHWMRLSLKGLADNKSAIGTKVEVFAGGNRQKFEIYGSNGYLGQNSTDIVVGLGASKDADIVRLLWPTGVLQDEIQVAGDKQHDMQEIDRRGSSCPTLFVWDGEKYKFVADMLGAGVVGHWIGPNQRDIPRPVEWIKIDGNMIREKNLNACHPEAGDSAPRDLTNSGDQVCREPEQRSLGQGSSHAAALGLSTDVGSLAAASPTLRMTSSNIRSAPTPNAQRPTPVLSFRFMEPLEEAVYLDQVRLLAVDHPANVDVYPNEYFASNPPYPGFKVVLSKDARPPASAHDEHGHDVLPDLLAHRYFGDFALTQFQGFAQPHRLTLDLGAAYNGGPLWLLMHGEVEYFSANSMYAASQAGVQAISPFVEAQDASGQWKRVVDDMGFPAGGPRTMTADLSGKVPRGTQKIRITTNLQVYWDSILINRTAQDSVASASRRLSGGRPAPRADSETWPADLQSSHSDSEHLGKLSAVEAASGAEGEAPSRQPAGRQRYHVTLVPLTRADLAFHGYPLKIEGKPAGNVQYIYEKISATGPYTRPMGAYTRYGDVLPLLTKTDDKLAVFGSGDEVRLDFDPSNLPALPRGWVRDYFFAANGYEKDMDFYAAEGNFVAPLPFLSMGDYPYTPKKSFPLDDSHVNYLLEYNTRQMSGNEQRGYWFDYGESQKK